ncbi:YegP family protein [Cryomorphaceae bacterium 1068]|nr:YegP family protein [Cryomorphaceae bacterium 1068]
MEPHFIINHLEEGVEVNFIKSKGKTLLEWKKFPDVETADRCIKKLKRYRNFNSYRYDFKNGEWRFYLLDSTEARICFSHGYSSKQKAEDGVKFFIRGMHNARTKENKFRE